MTISPWSERALRTVRTVAMASTVLALCATPAAAHGGRGGRSYSYTGSSYQVYTPPTTGYSGSPGSGPGGSVTGNGPGWGGSYGSGTSHGMGAGGFVSPSSQRLGSRRRLSIGFRSRPWFGSRS
jgi:hypothetical protein